MKSLESSEYGFVSQETTVVSQETAPETTGTACRGPLKSLESSEQGFVSQEKTVSQETTKKRQEQGRCSASGFSFL